MRDSGLLSPRRLPGLWGRRSHLESSSGRGIVYASTAVHRRDADPYDVVLVDLEGGFRMMSPVEGVPAEEVKVGTRVSLRVDREGDDPVPVFVPEDEGP